uniref:tRNA-uridine aminocarboxypropyltransferase n=1 Tax=Chromera velia CCMP2878 TaxID=1169474 RepID=A0A0G4HQA3_9ALVE|eukprot:Cvel_7886.t1-p1 / transcript=Cvel_7886.t1 / gene=Cvel_7886 / organism=Chromera_velia_CCMP2878 / gene_product=hypothetical protein / transcript_product=hypothetical protein / location=Cvel_scaffold422:86273-89367(+) / protein_length=770 / sequence_SO=supercontig / SO=protein_coding / is_pseudo=false
MGRHQWKEQFRVSAEDYRSGLPEDEKERQEYIARVRLYPSLERLKNGLLCPNCLLSLSPSLCVCAQVKHLRENMLKLLERREVHETPRLVPCPPIRIHLDIVMHHAEVFRGSNSGKLLRMLLPGSTEDSERPGESAAEQEAQGGKELFLYSSSHCPLSLKGSEEQSLRHPVVERGGEASESQSRTESEVQQEDGQGAPTDGRKEGEGKKDSSRQSLRPVLCSTTYVVPVDDDALSEKVRACGGTAAVLFPSDSSVSVSEWLHGAGETKKEWGGGGVEGIEGQERKTETEKETEEENEKEKKSRVLNATKKATVTAQFFDNECGVSESLPDEKLTENSEQISVGPHHKVTKMSIPSFEKGGNTPSSSSSSSLSSCSGTADEFVLFLLDGTWNQARHMRHRHAALRGLPSVSLSLCSTGSGEGIEERHERDGVSNLESDLVEGGGGGNKGKKNGSPSDRLVSEFLLRRQSARGRISTVEAGWLSLEEMASAISPTLGSAADSLAVPLQANYAPDCRPPCPSPSIPDGVPVGSNCDCGNVKEGSGGSPSSSSFSSPDTVPPLHSAHLISQSACSATVDGEASRVCVSVEEPLGEIGGWRGEVEGRCDDFGGSKSLHKTVVRAYATLSEILLQASQVLQEGLRLLQDRMLGNHQFEVSRPSRKPPSDHEEVPSSSSSSCLRGGQRAEFAGDSRAASARPEEGGSRENETKTGKGINGHPRKTTKLARSTKAETKTNDDSTSQQPQFVIVPLRNIREQRNKDRLKEVEFTARFTD